MKRKLESRWMYIHTKQKVELLNKYVPVRVNTLVVKQSTLVS